MARLSAENSADHVAALSTPRQKSEKKAKRFKEFFKGGHSRGSLSAGTSSGSPQVSPSMPSPLGGLENMKPGFEKVGLHPSERSRALDLDQWERVKEENQELGHTARIQLYKDIEQLKRRATVGSESEVWRSSSVNAKERQEGDKAMKLLGIEDNVSDENTAPLIDDEMTTTQGFRPFRNEAQRRWDEDASVTEKTESLRKSCEGPVSGESAGQVAQGELYFS